MASIRGQVRLFTRVGACILAGVPSTTLLPLPLTLALTRRYRREDRLRRLHLMVQWARFCRKHLLQIDLEVQGRHLLPSPSRGHMYVSNHQSWADILVLMDALDTVAFLSKALVRWIPVIGRCAYAGGTIYVQRGDSGSRQKALRETIQMCRESTAVVIFPEGTRSPDGELREKIHSAAIHAAFEHGIKVVPLAVDGTIHVVPKAMDTVNLGQHVAVTIGETLSPEDFTDAEAWIEAVWGRVKDLFAESRARRLQGATPRSR
jgi:1-acyl-sn-glycerol-3-phosphate acyltransferase